MGADDDQKTSEIADSFSEAAGTPVKQKTKSVTPKLSKKNQSRTKPTSENKSRTPGKRRAQNAPKGSSESRSRGTTPKPEPMLITTPYRKKLIVCIRVAETMNDIFPKWTEECFRGNKYAPLDGNHPDKMFARSNPAESYALDPPLTEVGLGMADMLGRGLVDKGVVISVIYVAPTLAAVQTAQSILNAQSSTIRIRVEPTLYNFREKKSCCFMSADEMKAAGFSIDTGYTPLSMDLVQMSSESASQQFERMINAVDTLGRSQIQNGTTLLVTSASVVHLLVRALLFPKKLPAEIPNIEKIYPLCSGVAVGQRSSNRQWKAYPGVIPSINWTGFSNRHSADLAA